MSKTISLYHIVFAPRDRETAIVDSHAEDLYRLMWNIIKHNKCYLLRINSMPDHLHMLIDLHPTVALSSIVGELKAKTSQWMHKSGYFPSFKGWCEGYFAESKGMEQRDTVIEYIKAQQEHHRGKSFVDEMKQLYHNNGIIWHDDDMC